jgi:hypothetical protein
VWCCGAGRQARLSADAPSEISPKRWRLDINLNFSQDAVLMLSSMNLPDGIQVCCSASFSCNTQILELCSAQDNILAIQFQRQIMQCTISIDISTCLKAPFLADLSTIPLPT